MAWKAIDRILSNRNILIEDESFINEGLVSLSSRSNTAVCVILRKDLSRTHDGVIKWNHFPRYWPFVRGIHRSPVNSPHKGQWRGALMFCLSYAWANGCANNRHTGDLRRHHAHYDVTGMCDVMDLGQYWFGHGTKPLPKPMLFIFSQNYPYAPHEHISVKFYSDVSIIIRESAKKWPLCSGIYAL